MSITKIDKEEAKKYIDIVSTAVFLTTREKEKLIEFSERGELTENYKEEIIDYLTDNVWKKKNIEKIEKN